MSCNIYAGNLKLHVMFGEMKHREERLRFHWTSAGCSVWHGTTSAPTRTWEQQLLPCHSWGTWNSPLDPHNEWAVTSPQPPSSSLSFARLLYARNNVRFLRSIPVFASTWRSAEHQLTLTCCSFAWLIVFWREWSGMYLLHWLVQL